MEHKVELVHFSFETEIEPANQSYPNRSEARIGHLFKQMTNINRRQAVEDAGEEGAPCKAASSGCEFELDV